MKPKREKGPEEITIFSANINWDGLTTISPWLPNQADKQQYSKKSKMEIDDAIAEFRTLISNIKPVDVDKFLVWTKSTAIGNDDIFATI